MNNEDEVWDKGTPFESGPTKQPAKQKPVDDDQVWDKGTPFESGPTK